MISTRSILCVLALVPGIYGTTMAVADDGAPVADAPTTALPPVAPKADKALETFLQTLAAYEEGGDYETVLKFSRTWQKSRPFDAGVWFVQGRALFYDGDYTGAIAAWEQAQTLAPTLRQSTQEWLDKARVLKQKWGDQSALLVVDNEITEGKRRWSERGRALLEAKNYDEIERIAAQLTQSQEAFADGSWALSFFSDGLTEPPENRATNEQWESQRASVEEWLRARPKSTIAHASLARIWSNGAWLARGGDYGVPDGAFSSIEARNNKTLEIIGDAGGWKKLVSTSPLYFETFHNWAMLTGADDAAYNEQLAAMSAAFPHYEDGYKRAAHRLLPRWYGGPGAWQKLAQTSADEVAQKFGAAAGDTLYARIVWRLDHYYPNGGLWENDAEAADWPRTKRGIENILQATPNSLATQTFYFDMAVNNRDWEDARAMLGKLNGRIDGEYYKYRRKEFAPQRVQALQEAPLPDQATNRP